MSNFTFQTQNVLHPWPAMYVSVPCTIYTMQGMQNTIVNNSLLYLPFYLQFSGREYNSYTNDEI